MDASRHIPGRARVGATVAGQRFRYFQQVGALAHSNRFNAALQRLAGVGARPPKAPRQLHGRVALRHVARGLHIVAEIRLPLKREWHDDWKYYKAPHTYTVTHRKKKNPPSPFLRDGVVNISLSPK